MARFGHEITARGVKLEGTRFYHMADRRGRAYLCDCFRAVDLRLKLGLRVPGARRKRFVAMDKLTRMEINLEMAGPCFRNDGTSGGYYETSPTEPGE